MNPTVAEVSRIAQQWTTFENVLNLLTWDQEVMMPTGGTKARGEATAFISVLQHRGILELGPALAKVSGNLNDQEKAIVREATIEYERAAKVPEELVGRIAQLSTEGQVTWRKARAENDFSLFAPVLEKIVETLQEYARAINPKARPYDALMQYFDPSLTTEYVDELLTSLCDQLKPLVAQREEAPQQPTSNTPSETQMAVCRELAITFGLPANVGRLDLSTHPASWWTGGDARITTRFEDDPWMPFSSTAHEIGHALYEAGIPRDLPAPLNRAGSLIIHESQSRLWENMVFLNQPFLRWYVPKINKLYGANWSVDEIFRWVNAIDPGFIRIEADEFTYPFHILLRFRIEQELIEGKLKVEDLPKRWNQLMQELLGITPPNDALGCLQDIHWSQCAMGYFPTYALGSMLSGQLYVKARKDIPNLELELTKGNTKPLLTWLRTNVHHHGRTYPTHELIKRATGEELNARAYVTFLKEKLAKLD